LPHAGKTAEITVGSDTYQIRIEDDNIAISAPRKTSREILRQRDPPAESLELSATPGRKLVTPMRLHPNQLAPAG